MKRKLILFCVILVSLGVSGQVHYIGFQGGLNLSNISSDDEIDSKFRNGFSSGLNYELVFPKKMTLGADLLYITQGYKNELIFRDELGNPTGGNATFKDFYDYLSLPLKVGYITGNRIKGFAKIGINTAVLLRARMIMPTFDVQSQVSGEEIFNVTKSVKKLDFGGIIELGAGFKLNEKFEIMALAGYRHSFTSFSNQVYAERLTMKHYAINFSLGIKYKLR